MNCCFTGHRSIKDTDALKERLAGELERLIDKGYTDFYAGGAAGFDTLCEQTVTELKAKYPQIKLHLILPCPPEQQSAQWSEAAKAEFRRLIALADEVTVISGSYYKGCMKDRNQRLVDCADHCVCYFTEYVSGTGQTVRMAQKKGIGITNLAVI